MNKKQRTHLENRLIEERDRVMKELGHYDESFSSTLQASNGDLSSYSFHMADQMPSSVKLGSRPVRSTIRCHSSSERP